MTEAATALGQRQSRLDSQNFDSRPQRAVVLRVSHERARNVLLFIALLLLALGVFRQLFAYFFAGHAALGPMMVLDLGKDNSVQEWWSVVQLTIAAGLLILNGIAEPERRWKPYWYALAAVFVFLSIDESAGVHEKLIPFMRPYGFTGFLKLAWIIPYGIACIVVGALFIPFLLGLPRDIRWRFVLAGGVFVGGALGLESLGGYLQEHGYHSLFLAQVVAEEGAEIIGILLFILALLRLLSRRVMFVTAQLEPPQ